MYMKNNIFIKKEKHTSYIYLKHQRLLWIPIAGYTCVKTSVWFISIDYLKLRTIERSNTYIFSRVSELYIFCYASVSFLPSYTLHFRFRGHCNTNNACFPSCYIQIAVHINNWCTLNQKNQTLIYNVLLVICQVIQHDSMIVDVVVNQTSESLHSHITRIGALMVGVLA